MIGAGVGASRPGDVCVVCPARGYPHQENDLHWDSWSSAAVCAAVRHAPRHRGNVNDAAWRQRRRRHENFARYLHWDSCSSISKCVVVAGAVATYPSARHPKACASGVGGASTSSPRHASTPRAAQSASYGAVLPHRRRRVASSTAAIDLRSRRTRVDPSSVPYAFDRGPMSHLAHAPIAAHVPQLPPPVPALDGPHATGTRVPCEFRRRRVPVYEGWFCCGHPYCE